MTSRSTPKEVSVPASPPTTQDREPRCMMCGSTKFDAESNERHPEYGPDVFEIWTYCKACDCWTEHLAPPSSPTSEPIPASEAPDDLTGMLRPGEKLPQYESPSGDDAYDAEFWATVARDEQGFVRTQAEWDTLATYAREQAAELASLRVENERLEQWKALARSDLRGLRSSALTAEEAQRIYNFLNPFPGKVGFLEEHEPEIAAKLSALRSSTPDKGNTK